MMSALSVVCFLPAVSYLFLREFVKDSPQTVKAVEPDDGNISGESSLLEADHATGVQHPQVCQDK